MPDHEHTLYRQRIYGAYVTGRSDSLGARVDRRSRPTAALPALAGTHLHATGP